MQATNDEATIADLHKILTSSRLRAAHDLQYPWPKDSKVNWNKVLGHDFDGADPEKQRKAWVELSYDDVLVPMSKMGIDKLPTDMLQFLPSPESDDFPILTLGLIVLLDQSPALLLPGMDYRYVDGYFRPLALRLVQQAWILPPHLHPWRLSRWEKLGYSYEHWLLRQMLFFAPLTHSEDIDNQALQHGMFENIRAATEDRTGEVDPHAAKAREDAHDVTMFSKLIRDGPPSPKKLDRDLTMADYCWWWTRIMDVHVPIIRKFGRYPYRNPMKGVDDTAEELEFLKATDWFGAPQLTGEEKQKLKEDITTGKWSPLQGPRKEPGSNISGWHQHDSDE